MSIENVGKFFELVKTNKNLTPEIAKIKNEIQNKGGTVDYEQVIIKKIIPLANEFGLDFSLEDFLSYTNTVVQQEKLSDDDLLNVSGGMSGKQGLAMLGIMLTLTPIASGFMGGGAVAETGEQQGSSKPTSSYSMNVDNDIDTASTNNQGAKNEDNLMTRALGVHTLNTSSDDEETVAGKFNGDTKIDVENDSENFISLKPSTDLETFNMSESKQNAVETAENKEKSQTEAKVNVDIEKKADDTEDKTDSLEDAKSDVSTEDTTSETTTTSGAEESDDLSTAAGSTTKAATETSSVKLSLNTLKEAVNYIFGGNIDESKTPSKQTYGNGKEIIYGWGQNNKPFGLTSDGVVISYNNGTASSTLQQKLSPEKMSELNNAESAAEETAKDKAGATAEEATKFEAETESNTDEVASTDDLSSETTESSKAEDGETYTSVEYISPENYSALGEMVPNLTNVIKEIGNDTNRISDKSRFNFLRDIRDFIGHTWNANTERLEVEGILGNDPNLEAILNFWTNVLGKNPYVIFDVQEDLPLSEKMEKAVKIMNRLDYVKNVDNPEKLISLVREIVCSKAYDTEDGTAKEWVNNASPKDKENFEFLENLYKGYKGPGKLLQYTKPGSLLDSNGLTEDAEKVIKNWVKIGNSILSIDELYETDKSEFKRDAKNIALNMQILLKDGDVYYGMPGVVPPETIINFVNIYYNLGLSKNISYTSVNSNDLNLLSDNLGAANKEIGTNIFNLAKDDIVDYVKDWERAQELVKQHKASSGDTANIDNDRANASTGKAAQKPEALNQTSEKELLDQVHASTDKTEKKNARIKAIMNKGKNNNASSITATEKAQGDKNVALSEAEEAQNSQNEARNHVDASNAAASAQSNQAKVDFIPLGGGLGSTLKRIMPTWLGGKPIEEQQLDHLINFIEETGISGREQVSAPTLMNYLAVINEIGPRIAVTRNETEEREKIYYFNGEVQDSSHSAAIATILRDFENLTNN